MDSPLDNWGILKIFHENIKIEINSDGLFKEITQLEGKSCDKW